MELNVQKTYTNGSLNGVKKKKEESLTIQVIRSEQDFDALQDDWEALSEETNQFIYQTFEWNRTWWEYFGKDKHLHIITVYEGAKLIAIAPFFWDRISINNRQLYSSLRLLGSSVSQPKGKNLMGLNPYSDYLDVIIQPDKEKQVIAQLVKYFKNNYLAYDEVVLDEIPENSCLWEILIPILSEKGITYKVEKSSECPIIKLEGSWDDYQQSLSKKARYNNNRALRMVDEDSKKGFHISKANNLKELHQSFDLLVKLHQHRWNQIGFPGVFAEERMYNFQREIIDKFFRKRWVQISLAEPVRDAGNVIAVDLLFKYNKRVYLVHRALDQDSKFSKAGPGNVLLSVAIKEAADNGLNALDFLRGTEAFKFRTANTVATNKRIVIQNPKRNPGYKTNLIKKYVAFKRRAGIEWYQIRLFMKGKTMHKGLRGYLKFLYSRFQYKMSKKRKK